MEEKTIAGLIDEKLDKSTFNIGLFVVSSLIAVAFTLIGSLYVTYYSGLAEIIKTTTRLEEQNKSLLEKVNALSVQYEEHIKTIK